MQQETCRRHGFCLWVGKISWRRKWQPTPVFLPGKSHGQRSLAGMWAWGHKRLGHDLVTEHVCTLPAIVSGTYVSGIGPTPWQRPCHMTRRHRTMCSEEPSWNNWKERYSDMGAICQAAQTITAIQRCKAHSGVQPKFTYSNKLLLWSADGHRILGWPKSSFGFFHLILQKTQTNFFVNPMLCWMLWLIQTSLTHCPFRYGLLLMPAWRWLHSVDHNDQGNLPGTQQLQALDTCYSLCLECSAPRCLLG